MGLQDGASRHLGALHPRCLEKEALALGAGFSFHLKMVELPSLEPGPAASASRGNLEIQIISLTPGLLNHRLRRWGGQHSPGGSDAPSSLRSSSLGDPGMVVFMAKSGLRSNSGFTVGGAG